MKSHLTQASESVTWYVSSRATFNADSHGSKQVKHSYELENPEVEPPCQLFDTHRSNEAKYRRMEFARLRKDI